MRLAAPLAIAGALLLGGCGSWNPLVVFGFKSEPAHKPTPLAAISASVSPKPAWTVKLGKSAGYRLRPQLDAGQVYAASEDGSVTILDADTGKIVSRTETKKKIAGGVTVAEGQVIVGTLKGEVISLSSDEKKAWTSLVAGEVIAPVAISRGVVVVRTADGRIFGLDARDGRRKWVFQRQTPALLLRSEAGVLAVAGDVVAGYPNGKLIALDIDDGKLTWEVTVSLPRGATELERIADVAGLPVIEGGTVCAAAYQGKVACFEIQSRNVLWSRDLSTALGLARGPRHVYAVDDNGAVHALDKSSGASVWKQDKLQYRKLTAPVVASGFVVVGDLEGFLHVLSPDDGSIVGRLATDGTPVQGLVAVPDGVLVQTAGGTLALVRI